MAKFSIGSKVKFNNLYGTVVGFDGSAIVFQPNGSSQKISVPQDRLIRVINENTNISGLDRMNS